MDHGSHEGEKHMEPAILVVGRGLELRVESHHLGDEGVTLLFDLLAGAILPGV